MKTLYLRNVPTDVSERIAALAAREGISVTTWAVRELSAASRRADAAALLDELPDLQIGASTIVEDLREARASR